MKTFTQYLESNHPEMLDENLRDIITKHGMAGLTAAAMMAAGARGSPSYAASSSFDPQAQTQTQEEFSSKPFNKEVGPKAPYAMTDYDLYYYQVKRVEEALKQINRGGAVPTWYRKMKDYYEGKRPRPPELPTQAEKEFVKIRK